jgi:drug/metabolite transporter (DMT)-like permease
MDEAMDFYKLIGAVLIFSGVYLTNRTKDEPENA